MNQLSAVVNETESFLQAAKNICYSNVNAITNNVESCLENPKGIPIFVTSLAMVNGGAIGTFQSGKKAIQLYKNGENLKALIYLGGAIAACEVSIVGGVS